MTNPQDLPRLTPKQEGSAQAAKTLLEDWAKAQTIDVTVDPEPTCAGAHQKLYARNNEGVIINAVKW